MHRQLQEQTIVFRQALAAAVAKLMDWAPEIKEPDLTLSAHVKEQLDGLDLEVASTSSKFDRCFHRQSKPIFQLGLGYNST